MKPPNYFWAVNWLLSLQLDSGNSQTQILIPLFKLKINLCLKFVPAGSHRAITGSSKYITLSESLRVICIGGYVASSASSGG